jgi:hypothetical protein
MKREFDFFDRPGNVKWIKRMFYAVLVLLFGLDFVIHKHPHFSWEELPGFYVIYGFLSCVVIVAVSKILGKLWLQKGEDYYDR